MSQFHLAATIKTGGAANGVKVPPIEILTNSTPMVAYFSRGEVSCENRLSRSINAASVMAAGSVINEPSRGTKNITKKYMATPVGSGSRSAVVWTSAPANCSTGRVPAITMMANTNRGSVKLRESR